jgi:hypothetical protein
MSPMAAPTAGSVARMTSVDSDDSIRFSWAGVVDDALAGTGACVGIDLDLEDLIHETN